MSEATIEQILDRWLSSLEDGVISFLRLLGIVWYISMECLEELFVAFSSNGKLQDSLPESPIHCESTWSIFSAVFSLDGLEESRRMPGTMATALSSPALSDDGLAQFYTPNQTYIETFDSPELEHAIDIPINPNSATAKLDLSPGSALSNLSLPKVAEIRSRACIEQTEGMDTLAVKHVQIRPLILSSSSYDALGLQIINQERSALGLLPGESSSLSFVGRPTVDGSTVVFAYQFKVRAEQDFCEKLGIEIPASTPNASEEVMTTAPSTPVLNASASPFFPSFNAILSTSQPYAPALVADFTSLQPQSLARPLKDAMPPLVLLQPKGSKAIPIVTPPAAKTALPASRILMERSRIQNTITAPVADTQRVLFGPAKKGTKGSGKRAGAFLGNKGSWYDTKQQHAPKRRGGSDENVGMNIRGLKVQRMPIQLVR